MSSPMAKLAKKIGQRAPKVTGGGATNYRRTRGVVQKLYANGLATVRIDGSTVTLPMEVKAGVYCTVGSVVEVENVGQRMIVDGVITGSALLPPGGNSLFVARAASATAGAGEMSYCTAGITLTLPTSPPAGTLNTVVAEAGVTTIAAPSPALIQWRNQPGASTVQIAPGMSLKLVYTGTGWFVTESAGGSPSAKMHPTAQTLTETGTVVTVGSMTTTWLYGGVTFASNQLTVPIAGEYTVKVLCEWQASGGSPGGGFYNAFVGITGSAGPLIGSAFVATATTFQPYVAASIPIRLNAGQKLSLMAQSSSSTAATKFTANDIFLSLRWERP